MTEIFQFDKPVLVTGANGFIGLRLVRRLANDGNQVRAFVLPGETIHAAMPDSVEISRGDISDRESVDRAMQGVGTVLHLASLVGDGLPDEAHQKITVGGAANVLEAAAGVQARSVLISSIVVYGDAIAKDRCDEKHAHGVAQGAYSRAKQAQERLAWQLVETKNLQLSVVRPGNVYGPGPTPWVRDVLEKMRKGLPILISGGDFNAGLVYVDNVVEVIIRAAALPQALGQTYNALDGSDITWKRYFGDVAKLAGLKKPSSIPLCLAQAAARAGEFIWWTLLKRKTAPSLTKEALALVGSAHNIPIDKAREQLKYTPLVSYDQGLASVADYIKQQA